MIEEERAAAREPDDYVEFHPTGARTKGAFRCTACGYGVVVATTLPRCPMCSGELWEAAEWSPFGRAGATL